MGNGAIGFVSVVVWLGLGGWALSRFMRSEKGVLAKEFGPVFVFCLVLAPFAAGFSLGEAGSRKLIPKDGAK